MMVYPKTMLRGMEISDKLIAILEFVTASVENGYGIRSLFFVRVSVGGNRDDIALHEHLPLQSKEVPPCHTLRSY
jgi:hypothetical protein